ncbi:EI24 domain-containing protein [soil metagenome]
MNPVLQALLRGFASLLHPRMLLFTLWPFVLTSAIWMLLYWLAAEPALNAVQGMLLHFPGIEDFFVWMFSGNVDRFAMLVQRYLAPTVLAVLVLPLIVTTVVLVVGVAAMPGVVRHLGRGRYASLERHGASGWRSLLDDGVHALWLTLIAIVLTIPLWLVPVIGWLLPLLLWGLVNSRIMGRDSLSAHADDAERRALLSRKRWPLWLLGVVTGALGIVPALVWIGGGVVAVFFAPVFGLLSLWLYVLVFTYTALTFAHYTLSTLERQRAMSQH